MWLASGAWNGRDPGYQCEQGSVVGVLGLLSSVVLEHEVEDLSSTAELHLYPCEYCTHIC